MSSLRLLGSAVFALVTLGAATVSLTPSIAGAFQPTSDSPLSPPPNGVRKVEPGSQSARSGWHAFTNATLHVSPTRTIQKATLVVRDGKIASVGAGGVVPPGAAEHDGSRLHIYAGFIEPYLETDVPRPEVGTPGTHWNPGVVPQRSALDKGSAGIDAKTSESLRSLGFAAAALAPRGGVIRGTSAVVSLARPSGDPSNSLPQVYRDGAYQMIGFETAARGSDGTDARPDDFSWSRYPNSQMGAVALIRQTLSDAAWQQAGRVEGWFTEPGNALDALRAPQVAAAEGASGPRNINGWNGLMLFDTANELEALRAAKIAKEFSRPAAILGSGREYARLQAITEDRLPLILPLNFPRAPEVGTLGAANAAELGDMMHWEQAPTNPRRVMAARSDDSVSLTTSRLGERDGGREAFAGRLSKAIKHGLKPEQALAMLTTNPAKLLGVESVMGTLDVGKAANLVVCDGPLFTEVPDAPKKDEPGYIRPARVVSVWIDGREHVIHPIAEVDIAGRYEVAFTPAPPPAGGEMKVFFDIDGQPEDVDLKITKVTRDDTGKEHTTEIEVKEFTRSGPGLSRFTFSFEHEPFGEKGVFQNSGLVERDGAGLVTLHGDFTRASGRQVSYIARRIGPPSPKKQSLAGAWPLVLDDAGKSGIVLLFDRGNVATLRLPPQLAAALAGADGKGDKPITTERFKYDGKSLSFEFESAPVGSGTIRIDAAVDFAAAPARMTGTMAIGNAEPKLKFAAARRDRNLFAGEWRVTQADGQAYPEDGPNSLIIAISGAGGGEGAPSGGRGRRGGGGAGGGSDTDRLAVTLRFTDAGKPPLEIAAENVEPRIGKLFFEHPLAQLGGEGSSRDELTITFDANDPSKDTLVGLGRLPDGSTHPYQARRMGTDGTEKKEATALKAIPESILVPVGPYALPESPVAERLVLTDVTLWTCKAGTSDTVIENGAIAVDGGKITYVGPMEGAPGGEGWKVMSMKGRFVTPGIIDCHSHTGISSGVNESGQAVTAEVRIGDVTNPDDVSWYRQLAGGVTCVNNLHGSANAIGGQSMVNKIRWGAARPDDMHFEGDAMAKPGIKFALGENPKQSNWGERNTTRYPQTRMGVETLIRDRFTAAKEYLALWAAPSAAGSAPPRRDLELEALAEILQGKRLIHCHSYRQDEILMLTRVARDFGFKIGTFQHILEGYKVADEMVKYSGGGSGFSDWWAYKVEVQDAIPYAGPLMHEQGVVVSYNSDSDEMARRLNVEAGKAAKYSRGKDGKSMSIPPHEAFKFVTLNPAKQLGAAGRIGTLEVGKDADLALWSGTPTNPTSRCEMTIVDGKVLFSTERDMEHRKRIASERARLIQKILASGDRPARGGEAADSDDTDLVESEDLREELADARSGGRRLLLMDAAIRAADWRREYYLDMLRRGLDPRWQRAGSCGCDELGF